MIHHRHQQSPRRWDPGVSQDVADPLGSTRWDCHILRGDFAHGCRMSPLQLMDPGNGRMTARRLKVCCFSSVCRFCFGVRLTKLLLYDLLTIEILWYSGLHEKREYRRLFNSYVAHTKRFANRNSLGMAPPLACCALTMVKFPTKNGDDGLHCRDQFLNCSAILSTQSPLNNLFYRLG
jgi:hypothetical protein